MAVQARHLSHSHAFFHGPHGFGFRAMEDTAVPGTGTVLLDDYGGLAPAAAALGSGGTTTVLSDFPRGDLACDYALEPRKQPRVAAGRFPKDQSVLMRPPAAQVGDFQFQGRRVLGSGAASSSGRKDDGASVSHSQSQGLLSSRLYHQDDVEIDALVRLESERIRAGLEEARRRHARELLAAASGWMCAAEVELERALCRNAELEDKARQMGAECQAWMGAARSHEAVAAGLRATLDQLQLLQSPPCACAVAAAVSVNEGTAAAEDAQSCCVEARAADANADAAAAWSSCRSCKACGGGDACVLVLPCRHLCLCRSCESAVDACPVCSAAKNASLHVLLC